MAAAATASAHTVLVVAEERRAGEEELARARTVSLDERQRERETAQAEHQSLANRLQLTEQQKRDAAVLRSQVTWLSAQELASQPKPSGRV